MNISIEKLIGLRKERGWSQEKLSAISGVSERTIQRVERDGVCSLDTKMIFASVFEVPPSELDVKPEEEQRINVELRTNWGGVIGLFVIGLTAPIILLLTATNGKWEVASLALVWGLTIIFTVMNYGFKATYKLFDSTSWIVKYPSYVKGLSNYIVQAKTVIEYAYIVGIVASLVAGLTIAAHMSAVAQDPVKFLAYVTRPLVYSILFVEFWFRPYKKRMESMLAAQSVLLPSIKERC